MFTDAPPVYSRAHLIKNSKHLYSITATNCSASSPSALVAPKRPSHAQATTESLYLIPPHEFAITFAAEIRPDNKKVPMCVPDDVI